MNISYQLIPGLKYKKRKGNPDEEKINRIIAGVCNYFSITRDELMCRKRTDDLVYARHWCIWFILNNVRISLKNLGELMGGRDHTTIIFGRETINNQLCSSIDNYYKDDYRVLEEEVLRDIVTKTGRPFKKSGSRSAVKAEKKRFIPDQQNETKIFEMQETKEEKRKRIAIYSNKSPMGVANS